MRRSLSALFLAMVVLVVVGAGGCGSATSAPPSTTAPPASSGSASKWLVAQAGQWNAALNGDQNSVDSAASTTSGVASSAYFSHLEAACTKMLDDAKKAKTLPEAPASALQDAWSRMLAATETYAHRCLQVVASQSTDALAGWKSSLTSMNSANQKWNQAVGAVQNAAKSSSG